MYALVVGRGSEKWEVGGRGGGGGYLTFSSILSLPSSAGGGDGMVWASKAMLDRHVSCSQVDQNPDKITKEGKQAERKTRSVYNLR